MSKTMTADSSGNACCCLLVTIGITELYKISSVLIIDFLLRYTFVSDIPYHPCPYPTYLSSD